MNINAIATTGAWMCVIAAVVSVFAWAFSALFAAVRPYGTPPKTIDMKKIFTFIAVLFLICLGGVVFGQTPTFTCAVPERAPSPTPAALLNKSVSGTLCSEWYVQVDHSLVAEKGQAGAEAYINDLLLNQVTRLYAHPDMDVQLSFNIEYMPPGYYTAGSSIDMLQQLRNNTPTYNGDLCMLLTSQVPQGGGVAWVDQACGRPLGYSVMNVGAAYRDISEAIDFVVHGTAHEAGHTYSSPHTQDCAFGPNGDQAIDGCVQGVGTCPRGPIPIQGGSIMSYCHFVPGVGISTTHPWHPEVVQRIRSVIAARCNCTPTDDPDQPDNPTAPDCENNVVFVETILDGYPYETTWTVTDADGNYLLSRGGFAKSDTGRVISDTLCLPDGCYTYTIYDAVGDGLVASGCVEGLWAIYDGFGEFGSGQAFTDSVAVEVCVGDYDEPEPADCYDAGPRRAEMYPHPIQHKTGGVSVFGDRSVKLTGNTWQEQIIPEYLVTENTVLTLDVKVDALSEIHGIALFDRPRGYSARNTFVFAGTQAWGVEVADVPMGEWVSLTIPVGDLIPHTDYDRIQFVCDADRGPLGTVAFRNVEMCEDGSTRTAAAIYRVRGNDADELTVAAPLHPNPCTDTLHLPTADCWTITDVMGRTVMAGEGKTALTAGLTPGVYFYVPERGRVQRFVKR